MPATANSQTLAAIFVGQYGLLNNVGQETLNNMKKSFFVILVLGLISLSGFINESADYEQITFDYFVSDIVKTDFKDVMSFEFKGRTEESFSTLGQIKFCLKPEEKLGAIIEDVTKGKKRNTKEIEFKNVEGPNITEFHSKSSGHRLFLFPSVHVADNYYVFLVFQTQKGKLTKYVFELTPKGEISRSCKMD
jgi:hypothetical protein